MDTFHCVWFAEKNIYDARRFLETRSAVLWVCDRVFSAMTWAMEAWIIGKGYNFDSGSSGSAVRTQFLKLAPPEIRSPATYCAAQAVMLNYDREGGLDHKEKPMPFDRWEELAFELIEKAEKSIVAIEKDIGCSKKQLKSLWLHKRHPAG